MIASEWELVLKGGLGAGIGLRVDMESEGGLGVGVGFIGVLEQALVSKEDL